MILSCSNIKKSFSGEDVLRDVSLQLEEREKAALIGINGAAAHKAPVGSLLIIAAYAQMTPEEAAAWHPTVIFPKDNRI